MAYIFLKMANIFTQTCPDDLEVGAIDNAERTEDVLEQYHVREVMKIFFNLMQISGKFQANYRQISGKSCATLR